MVDIRLLVASGLVIAGPALAQPQPGNPAGVPLAPGPAQPAIPVTPNISVMPSIGSQGGVPQPNGGQVIINVPAGSNVTVGVGAGASSGGGASGGVGITVTTP